MLWVLCACCGLECTLIELYMGSVMGVVCVLLFRVYYLYAEFYMGSVLGVVCVLWFRVCSVIYHWYHIYT